MAGFWRHNDPRSEFGGKGVLDSTLYPKGQEALTPGDKLRLMSLTGQEEDPKAPLDPYFWNGNVAPEVPEPGITEEQILDANDPYKK